MPPAAVPSPSPAARLILIAIQGYRLTLSALLGRQCRFAPTCSEYTADAVRSHGALRGRLARPEADRPLPSLGRIGLRPGAAAPPDGAAAWDLNGRTATT